MRIVRAHDHVRPGPSARQAGQVAPTTQTHQRRRGRSALAALTSTGAFSNARLSVFDRHTVLFAIASLSDDDGTLTRAYLAVQNTHGQDPEHWSRGMDLGALRRHCSKFLGKGAHRAPYWEELHCLFAAALPVEQCARLLPWAAGLHCRARGIARPPGYTGPVVLPDWSTQTVVAADTIRAAIRDGPSYPCSETLPPVDDAPAGVEESPEDPVPSASHDPESLWIMVQYLIRQFRKSQDREHEQWALRSEVARLTRACEELIGEKNPGLSKEEVRAELVKRVGTTRAHLPPLPRSRHRPSMALLDHHDRCLAPAPPPA